MIGMRSPILKYCLCHFDQFRIKRVSCCVNLIMIVGIFLKNRFGTHPSYHVEAVVIGMDIHFGIVLI